MEHNRWPGPPQSSNLNMMESVWDCMKREKTLRRLKSTEDLRQVLQEAENKLPKELEKLRTSVTARSDAVLQAMCDNTK